MLQVLCGTVPLLIDLDPDPGAGAYHVDFLTKTAMLLTISDRAKYIAHHEDIYVDHMTHCEGAERWDSYLESVERMIG